jgi:hypothetical protein
MTEDDLTNDDIELILSGLIYFKITRHPNNPIKGDIEKLYTKIIKHYPKLQAKFEQGFIRG